MLQEKAQHLAARIWAGRITERSFHASAEPCVSGAVDEPVFHDRLAHSVAISRARIRAPAHVPVLDRWIVFRTCASGGGGYRRQLRSLLHELVPIARVHRGITVAMKNNGRNSTS